ncbi:TPA: hypothetical protein DCX15_01190, partial [bacterium]|nr:hypothetical protein [bacterium]
MGLLDIFNRTKFQKKVVEPSSISIQKEMSDPEDTGVVRGYDRFPSTTTFAVRRYVQLSWEELRRIYIQSSAVRPAVDSIVRQVSLTPWVVVGEDEKKRDEVERFFNNPNRNKERFSELLAKVLKDILIYDAGAIEKVKSLDGKLREIYARDGSTIKPISDEYGLLRGYEQEVYIQAARRKVIFEPDELIYLSLYPSSEGPWG